ncbi:MAG: DUF1674 domain-containing protein [Ectothiorhodospiraceae bacterium]|jgi:hypothetical protein
MSDQPKDTRSEESTTPTDRRKDNTAVDWERPETWPEEVGGSKGPEPTRYGDWEHNGRCSDF